MSEPYSFSHQAAVGKQGELAARQWLEGQGYSVTDVSSDSDWQARDIDFLIYEGDDPAYRTVEVKTDTHPPAAMFVELTVSDKPGYLYKSRADILLYYYPGYQRLVWLSVGSLAWWVHEHASDLRRIQVRSKRGGAEWVAEGIVVPIAPLVDAGLAEEYDLNMVYGRTA